MGGFGAWEIAMEYPGYFSAVAPVCGGGMEWRASLIGNTPVWAFHGEDDDTVPVGRTKDMVKTLKAAGGNVKITLYPGVGHNCWDNAYDKEELIDWLLSQSKLI
ncbi:hypothetical protein SDC9_167990 [bioreactor metagenome]|uniref:Dienelactone hydrolase domain-containing protein n=1 Tax=bioreactor metagenome TaxID=1076179 RepID=A0A645G1B9_9ZZZZ